MGMKCNVAFSIGHKKPAEAGFLSTITTSCRRPSWPGSFFHDSVHILAQQRWVKIKPCDKGATEEIPVSVCKPFAIPRDPGCKHRCIPFADDIVHRLSSDENSGDLHVTLIYRDLQEKNVGSTGLYS